MKRLVLFSLMFILLAVGVSADFKITLDEIISDIYPDQSATYTLTIFNFEENPQQFIVYSSDVAWNIETKPSQIVVQGNSAENIILNLIPNAWANTGPQQIKINVESVAYGDISQVQVPVYIRNWGTVHRDYVPSVELRVTMADELDPRENLPVLVYLRNRNRRNITVLKIRFESNLINEEFITSLPPEDEKSEERVFKLNDLTKPQEDELKVTLWVGNNSINQVKKHYEVSAYSDMKVERDSQTDFFKTTTIISVTNNGNYENTKEIREPMSIIRRLFTEASGSNYEKLDKKRYIVWDITLEPLESDKVTIITNYRLIIYAVLIIIISYVAYFVFRSPVISHKDAMMIGSPHEGISEMKILLHIKNRSREMVEHISVTDKIPRLADLISESYMGTLEPTKILHNDKKGTLIKWDLPSLEPFEERIITYRVKSKLSIIGGIRLPKAKIRFETPNGKERIIHSNTCSMKIQ